MPARVEIIHTLSRDFYCDEGTPEQLETLWDGLGALRCSTLNDPEEFCGCLDKIEINNEDKDKLINEKEKIEDSLREGILKRVLVDKRKVEDISKLEVIAGLKNIIGDESECLQKNNIIHNTKAQRYASKLFRTEAKMKEKYSYPMEHERDNDLNQLMGLVNEDILKIDTQSTLVLSNQSKQKDLNKVIKEHMSTIDFHERAVDSIAFNRNLIGGEQSNQVCDQKRQTFAEMMAKIGAAQYLSRNNYETLINDTETFKNSIKLAVGAACAKLSEELAFAISPENKFEMAQNQDEVNRRYAILTSEDKNERLIQMLKRKRQKDLDNLNLAEGQENSVEALEVKFNYDVTYCSIRTDFSLARRDIGKIVEDNRDELLAIRDEDLSLEQQIEGARKRAHYLDNQLRIYIGAGVGINPDHPEFQAFTKLAQKQGQAFVDLWRLKEKRLELFQRRKNILGNENLEGVYLDGTEVRGDHNIAIIESPDGVLSTKSAEEIKNDRSSLYAHESQRIGSSAAMSGVSTTTKKKYMGHVQKVMDEKISRDLPITTVAQANEFKKRSSVSNETHLEKPSKVEVAKISPVHQELKDVTVGSNLIFPSVSDVEQVEDIVSPIEEVNNGQDFETSIKTVSNYKNKGDIDRFESIISKLKSQQAGLDEKLKKMTTDYSNTSTSLDSKLKPLQQLLSKADDEIESQSVEVKSLEKEIQKRTEEVNQQRVREAISNNSTAIQTSQASNTAGRKDSNSDQVRASVVTSPSTLSKKFNYGGAKAFSDLPGISEQEQYDLDLLALKEVSLSLNQGTKVVTSSGLAKTMNSDLSIKAGVENIDPTLVLSTEEELVLLESEKDGKGNKKYKVKESIKKKVASKLVVDEFKELNKMRNEFFEYDQFMKLLGESQN